MARPLRIEFDGAIYHVTVRGNARQAMFLDNRDRNQFLKQLAQSVGTYDIRLYIFCLMTNHFHLLLETPQANLSRFMHALETAYTVYFNLSHNRQGHLTQGRYDARLVHSDRYLLRLSRYVHLNPVRVGKIAHLPLDRRVKYLREYQWSSYRSYIGRTKPLEFVQYAPVLALLGGGKPATAAVYRKFVETGLAETDEDLARILKASPRCIGGEAFRRWVDGLYAKLLDKRDKKEDASFHRQAATMEPEAVLKIVSGQLNVPKDGLRQRTRGSMARAVAAQMLCKYAGITQREAAAVLGLKTGTAVSHQLKKLRRHLAENRELARAVSRIEKALRARSP